MAFGFEFAAGVFAFKALLFVVGMLLSLLYVAMRWSWGVVFEAIGGRWGVIFFIGLFGAVACKKLGMW
jgi:hypothetical protein